MINLTLTKVKSTNIEEEGIPQVKLVPLDMPLTKRKMGTLKDSISIPDNFDHLFEDEIADMFNKSN